MIAYRRGTVVVAVVIALVILQLLVYVVSVAGARDQDLTNRRLEGARSYYAAEAVANMAIREIGRNADEDGNGTIGAVSTVGTGMTIGPGGAGAWATAATSAGVTTVTADGASVQATRTITANVQRMVAPSTLQGLFTEMWSLTTAPSVLANVPWTSAPGWATVMPNVNLSTVSGAARWPGGPTGNYGIRFSGNIVIPTTGTWSFRLSSDDGSDLWINGVRVVNNDGLHGTTAVTGSATLAAGTYTFECRFFERSGSSNVWVEWQGPGVASWTLVPTTAFTCSPSVSIPPVAVATTVGITGGSGSPVAGVDGFNSSLGVYGSGNVLSSGVLMSTNAVTSSQWMVLGNAALTVDGRVGVGGSPGTVIWVLSPATMTGTNAALTRNIGPIVQGRPLSLPASSGAYNSNSDTTISSDRRYTSFSSGGNGVITISGNISIIIDGTMTMAGTSAIVLAPNATLDLYVGDTLTLNGNSAINAASRDPKRVNLHIFNASSRDLALNSQAVLYAVVRNPFGRLYMTGTTELFGTYHGNSLFMMNNARVHADVAAIPSGGTSAGQVVLKAWTQTP